MKGLENYFYKLKYCSIQTYALIFCEEALFFLDQLLGLMDGTRMDGRTVRVVMRN